MGQVYQVFAKVDLTNRVAIRTPFGTGYSALGRVTREPLICLRFDFRSRIGTEKRACAYRLNFTCLISRKTGQVPYQDSTWTITALIRVGFDLGTFLPKVINKHWPTSKDQSLRGSRTASGLPEITREMLAKI